MNNGKLLFAQQVRKRASGFLLGMLVGGLLFGSLAFALVLIAADRSGDERVGMVGNPATAAPITPTPEPIRVIIEIKMDLPTEIFEVTAYTAGPESTGKTPDHPAYGITASGAHVKEGVTIACPPSMPFGTHVYIPYFAQQAGDNGIRVCQDRGSAITDGKLDVYMSDLDKALEFGRRALEVVVLSESIEKEDKEDG